MILDSSAVVAVLLKEPGWDGLLDKIASAKAVGIGAPTLAETGIVLTARTNTDAMSALSRFLQESGITRIPFGDPHWREAVQAYLRYGKGRHRAGLNFGDCMTYATASLAQQPLLCVGTDFQETDLILA